MSTLRFNTWQNTGGTEVANSTLGTGKILQVVSTTKTDTFSASVASGASVAVTGLTATITPSSTSSKVLVIAQVTGMRDNTGGSTVHELSIAPTRGGTVIAGATGDAAGSRGRIHAQNRSGINTLSNSTTIFYLDSPASTSSLTYGVNVFCGIGSGNANLLVNRTQDDSDAAWMMRSASTITVMEVSA